MPLLALIIQLVVSLLPLLFGYQWARLVMLRQLYLSGDANNALFGFIGAEEARRSEKRDFKRRRASIGAAVALCLGLRGALEAKKFVARTFAIDGFVGADKANGAVLFLVPDLLLGCFLHRFISLLIIYI